MRTPAAGIAQSARASPFPNIGALFGRVLFQAVELEPIQKLEQGHTVRDKSRMETADSGGLREVAASQSKMTCDLDLTESAENPALWGSQI
jgi:hypothetical protein